MRPDLSGEGDLSLLPPDPGDEVAFEPVVSAAPSPARGPGFALSDLRVELGDPALGSQLEGEGFLRLDDPRISLDLYGQGGLRSTPSLPGRAARYSLDWLSAVGQGAGYRDRSDPGAGQRRLCPRRADGYCLARHIGGGVFCRFMRGAISLPGRGAAHLCRRHRSVPARPVCG